MHAVELETGEWLTHWAARVAVACYVVRVAADVSGWKSPRAERTVRWIWTAGCVFIVAHVICAFQFYHGWSHAVAYQHTARETAAAVGIEWGGGLYINYLFLGFWITDVTAWWWMGSDYAMRRWWHWMVHAVFAFMIVNSTIVFGPPYWQRVGVVAAGILALLYVSRWTRKADHCDRS